MSALLPSPMLVLGRTFPTEVVPAVREEQFGPSKSERFAAAFVGRALTPHRARRTAVGPPTSPYVR
jgi:hypothetical protein